VRNIGVDTITSFKLNHQLNAETIVVVDWSGVLVTAEQDTIQVDIINFLEGDNLFNAFVSEPNGIADEVPINDARQDNFTYLSTAQRLSLELTSDLIGYETSWEIWNDNEEVIFSGGPYDFGGVHINEEWCVEEGCYIFSLYDTGGNGWSSPNIDLGLPRYYIRGENDVLIALLQNQNFGFLEEVEFCLPYVCSLDVSANFEPISTAGANDGIIALLAENALPPIQYSIDGGENFKSNPVFGGLSEGTYHIEIIDARGCVARDTLVLPLLSSTVNINNLPSVEILPNPTEGFIFVNVHGVPELNYLSVQILNERGQIIKERRLANYNGVLTGQLSLVEEPAGLYFIRFRDSRIHQIKKVIKQ
jgi:hypothetical protein